jgi:predicted  nucleic acid-binding Zn-ribbon protein
MPRQKRGSRVLEYSEQRITALKSIKVPESSNALSITAIQKSIDATRSKLNEYNATLSVADQLNSEVKELEKTLVTLNDRMLSSIAATYGRTSSEYARVGSIRRVTPKRRAQSPEVATPAGIS